MNHSSIPNSMPTPASSHSKGPCRQPLLLALTERERLDSYLRFLTFNGLLPACGLLDSAETLPTLELRLNALFSD